MNLKLHFLTLCSQLCLRFFFFVIFGGEYSQNIDFYIYSNQAQYSISFSVSDTDVIDLNGAQ